MTTSTTQLAIIGAGPGGYAAAFMASDLGLQVTLVDPEANPGGVCLYRGCIPSKTLLHAAKIIKDADRAREWGLHFKALSVDVKALRKFKQRVVTQLTDGLGQLVKRRKIEHIRGHAAFANKNTLLITNLDGTVQRLSFEHAIIATGSKASTLSVFDEVEFGVLDATAALDLKQIPRKLLVVGGGYIGLELGSVYAALGSKVSVLEAMPELLPEVDQELVRIAQKQLQTTFEEILLQTTVVSAKSQKNGLMVSIKNKDGKIQKRLFDQVLVAVGRRPQIDGLSIEKIGLDTDINGFVQVDKQCRTSQAHIFAIGDVAGQPMLAHKASHEGRVAAEAIAGKKTAFDPLAIPAVVFIAPEIAWTGLTEVQAKAQGLAYEVARFPWSASSRAATLDEPVGLTKLLLDPQTDMILGMAIVGPHAGELIAESTLAIEMGANATDLGLTIHPHPSLSETIMEAAHLFHHTAAHYFSPKRPNRR